MRTRTLLLAFGCTTLVACFEPTNANPIKASLAECVRRATSTGSTELACDCGTCSSGDVCTKVGRCGKSVEAAAQPAKVMLVLDHSGSMKTLPESDTQWGCSADANGNGYAPSGNCKWNELRDLVAGPGGLLEQGGSQARFGLALFPSANASDSCGAGRVEVGIPPAPGESSDRIASTLQSIAPSGGTPSGATLRDVASDAAFTAPDASRYVVLVTDGMPNCNSNMAITSCQACTNGGDPATMCGDPRNCLDEESLVSAVRTLEIRGIQTFVVGFGASLASPEAAAVLDAAAEAGGRPLAGDRKYHLAGSGSELQAILAAVGEHLQPCIYALSPEPADPDSLQVLMTDRETAQSELLVRGDDWDYAGSSYDYVEVKGARCEAIQASSSCHYSLEFIALTGP